MVRITARNGYGYVVLATVPDAITIKITVPVPVRATVTVAVWAIATIAVTDVTVAAVVTVIHRWRRYCVNGTWPKTLQLVGCIASAVS